MELSFDDPALAEQYCSRLWYETNESSPAGRIHVLYSAADADRAPPCRISEIAPAMFHAALAEAGLAAIFPFQARFWQFCDLQNRVAVQLAAGPDDLPAWDAGAPLRRPLQWLLGREGLRIAHAATAGLPDRGVILFGKGGAGKSATTLAALSSGLSTVGDDYVALGSGDVTFARPLFRHVKQDPAGMDRVPGLRERVSRSVLNWRGKVEFDPQEPFPKAFVAQMRLGAVLVPRIAHLDRPEIVAVNPSEAMLALMNTNLHQNPGEPDRGMSFFSQVLRDLPCFRLNLSHHAPANGEAVKAFVSALPA